PNGDLQVKLLTMGVSFQIPAAEKPKMVRVVPALYHQGAENKWIAVGFSGYYPSPASGQAKFCGADVLFDGMAPYADSVGRPPYPGNKPLEVKKYAVPTLKKDATVVPFCQSVRKDGAYYRFEDYQPYTVSYTTP
ncbi:MAG TPA: hypothetical protein VFX30_01660, partial [bacterium]|nr:hypothetical protein [bacterium]